MSPQKAGRENKRLRLCRAGVTAAVAGCTNKANGPRGGSPAAPNKPNRRWSVVQTKPIGRQRDPAGCTNKPNSHRAGQVSLDGKKGYVLRQRLSHKQSRFPGKASRQTPCGVTTNAGPSAPNKANLRDWSGTAAPPVRTAADVIQIGEVCHCAGPW
jgi:hypothetical protein